MSAIRTRSVVQLQQAAPALSAHQAITVRRNLRCHLYARLAHSVMSSEPETQAPVSPAPRVTTVRPHWADENVTLVNTVLKELQTTVVPIPVAPLKSKPRMQATLLSQLSLSKSSANQAPTRLLQVKDPVVLAMSALTAMYQV